MKNKNGFALLISIIFTSVVLALSLALSSIGYKQQVLASVSVGSQHAFYAADAALECALYADQQENLFNYATHSASNPPNAIMCNDVPATQLSYSYDATRLLVLERLSLSANRCADITVYKYAVPQSGVATRIFSQGYDTSCDTVTNQPANARFVSRGINIRY